MLKKSLLYLTITVAMVVLLPGYGFSKHGKGNLATIEYPAYNQQVAFEVVKVVVQLEQGADLKTCEKAPLIREQFLTRFT